MNIAKLKIGTKVFNHGDNANRAQFGIVKEQDISFDAVTILWEDNSTTFNLPVCMFSDVYKNSGLTRLVLKKEYIRWKKECLALMVKRMQEVKGE